MMMFSNNIGGMTMNRSGKKCVLYPRVSTEMQVDGFSLDGQKNSLTRFADREEMEIINGAYGDGDFFIHYIPITLLLGSPVIPII